MSNSTAKATAARSTISLPASAISRRPCPQPKSRSSNSAWGETETTSSEFALEAAVEALCYDYFEQEHGGWENNHGAYGEFHIAVKEQTIDLEFYSRYTDVEKYSHSF